MNKIIYIILVASTFALPNTLFAQNSANKETYNSLQRAKEGTFQFIATKNVRELFTNEILVEIEGKRSDTEVIMWEYSAYTTIRILPKNIINAPNFIPIPEEETYIISEGRIFKQ